ncbi:acyl-CoA dehydrogenase family protein [Cumulibacter manganitolerans]|uniref:acyl-CoA dehydrogenase family protein n=1 Tax=Cumulibacter manganitolerans TaxID=1884992 RepID=UPI0012978402|nr:acyl-CoA dehydrogenase family protein [Cumulibacter manganitolerans]
MDLTYTSEQQALRDSLSRYLDRTYTFDQRQELLRSDRPWSGDAWKHFTELGLTALPFDEEAGGIGGTMADIVAVGEILGEYLCVEPYVSCVVLAGQALRAATGSDPASRLLEAVIGGEAQVAFAHEEGAGTPAAAHVALTAREGAGGHRLTGRKELVLGAAQASAIVVTARLDGAARDPEGLALLLVDASAPGISFREYRTIDGRAAASVDLQDVPAQLLAQDATEVIEEIIANGIIALAAEAVGAMNALLRQTIEYAATRQQFGVPIGSFQVLAHRMANMKMAYLNARATLLHTTALAEAGTVSAVDTAVLKAQVARFGRTIFESAIQLHGGIGTTDELPIGHYAKRILAFEPMFGDPDFHLRAVGAAAGVPAR